mgnify:CR=1 FL=1
MGIPCDDVVFSFCVERQKEMEMHRLIRQSALLMAMILFLYSDYMTGHSNAQEAPALNGIDCYNHSSRLPGWTNTLKIGIALDGITGEYSQVDIDENATFESPTTALYLDRLSPMLRSFTGHTKTVKSVAISQAGLWALSASEDKSVRL